MSHLLCSFLRCSSLGKVWRLTHVADVVCRLTWAQQSHDSLAQLPLEGYRLVLPYIWSLFNDRRTQVGAVRMVSAVASKLGKALSKELLLPRIISLLEVRASAHS